MTEYTAIANYFRLRQAGYALAVDVAERLDALYDDDATLVREIEPTIRVEESDRSGSTYVYLDNVCSRISDHPGGAAGQINERLSAAEMVERWLEEACEDEG